jgi:SAM-dependent methyltransferase
MDNKAIYDANWELWADQKVYGPASRWLRWLVKTNLHRLDASRVKEVLDVGCGEGNITALIARELPRARVLGIDFSKTGIHVAQRRYREGNLGFMLDIESRALVAQAFDLVTAFEVLEHVEDWQALLGRMLAATRRYVMLSFPTGRMRPCEVKVGHVRNFKRGEVEAFLAQQGFAPVNVFYAGFPFFSPIFRDLCNLTNAVDSPFITGKYTWRQKAVSALVYASFRYGSLRRLGDQFCGIFVRKQESPLD